MVPIKDKEEFVFCFVSIFYLDTDNIYTGNLNSFLFFQLLKRLFETNYKTKYSK